MRIALNLTTLAPGRTGGMETYVRNLLAGYSRLDHENEIRVLVSQDIKDIVPQDDRRFSQCVTDAWLPWLIRKQKHLQVPWQWIASIRAARRFQADIHHCPFNVPAPPWDAITNTVITMHDVQFFTVPELRAAPELHYVRSFCRRGVQFAKIIITDSCYSKQAIVDFFQIDPGRVVVIYPGFDEKVFRAESITGQAKNALPVPGPYLFFPAATWPHKNHLRLLEALALLRDRKGLKVDLLLTGFAMTSHTRVQDAVRRLRLETQVNWLGWITTEELVNVYRNAQALMFPSLHEGFGLPIVEAMACGCPVLCSNTTACGETAGNAALTFNPLYVEEIATQIDTIWSDDSIRKQLAVKGLERSQQFTCERMAEETLKAFASAIR